MKTAFFTVIMLVCFLISPASAYNNLPTTYELKAKPRVHHHHWRHHRRYAKRYHYRHYAHRRHRSSHISMGAMPAPLAAKVSELQKSCGSALISGLRPGARVKGSGRVSNHARGTAADVQGNPRCIYAHLKGWPGGYSIDYAAVNHVHISYDRGHEWGARFVHGGGYWRYASRHRHHRYAAR